MTTTKSRNPFFKRRAKQHGIKAERHVCKRLNATLTPASGALEGAKSDFFTHNMRFESKSTIKTQIILKHEWFLKIALEARETNKIPVLVLQFVNGNGQPKQDGSWVCLPEKEFEALCEDSQKVIKKKRR